MSDLASSSPPAPSKRRGTAAFAAFVDRLSKCPRAAGALAVLCALAGLLSALGWVPSAAWRSEGQRQFREWSVAGLWWSLSGLCAYVGYRGLRASR